MDKNDLMKHLVEETEYSESEVAEMTNTELLDHWLEYNGICGYTEDIKDVIDAAFEVAVEAEPRTKSI